jgi:hypothetical protein
MSTQDADAFMQQPLCTVERCNATIYGEEQVAPPTGSPIMLQSVVDLLSCNWDRVKVLYTAPPGQQAAAGLQSAAAAVNTALQAAAAVAAAVARGDAAAADAAAAEAMTAAVVAEQ